MHQVHARRPTVLIEAEEKKKIDAFVLVAGIPGASGDQETQKIHPLELEKEDSFDREARLADERAGKLLKDQEDKQKEREDAKEIEEEEEEVEIPLESQIGRVLSERTTRTVVMLVLCMLFILPFLQLETYVST